MRRFVFGTSLAVVIAAAAVISIRAAGLPACDPDNGGLKLPDGFCALVAADNLGAARHMVVMPNGDLYVTTQDSRAGAAGVVVTGCWTVVVCPDVVTVWTTVVTFG